MSESRTRFQQALRDAAKQEFEHIPNAESEIDHSFSQAFQTRTDRLLSPHHQSHSGIPMALQRAACILLVFALFFGCAMSVEAIRTPILSLLYWDEFLYVSSHGYDGEAVKAENGMRCIVYTGGELHFPYQIKTSRVMEQQSIGLMIFLDGQPQPYKTSASDSYQYVHRFTNRISGTIQEELIFTPVTGQAGDTLQISVMCIVNPEEYLSPDGIQQPFWNWQCGHRMKIQYQATPPEQSQAAASERVNGFSVRQEEAAVLTSGWSQEALENNIGFRLYVNDAYQDTITKVDASQPLRLRLVLWGSDKDSHTVVFFINHEPITAKPENTLMVRNLAGHKTIIEAEIDISDLQGEAIVYAMLSSKENAITTSDDWGDTVSSQYFIFTCE